MYRDVISVVLVGCCVLLFVFFFNDTATTEIYTLSLHDALPISRAHRLRAARLPGSARGPRATNRDRKSTRLNSSHHSISYAVFCLQKKTQVSSKVLLPVLGDHYGRVLEAGGIR